MRQQASPAAASPRKPLLRVLSGERLTRPPFWLMRQAGRYLPEYRAVRAKAGSFLDLCLTPDLACEVTLQPIRRYGMDAAILFSDILVVPYGLGQRVTFEEGRGPLLEPISAVGDLAGLELGRMKDRLAPVYETVRRVRDALPMPAALIGFAGAPWTVASYMIEGGSSEDFAKAKGWARRDAEGFQKLIDRLIEATIEHLSAQVDAGAEALQIFDSWANAWARAGETAALRRWCLEPVTRIVAALKLRHPQVPVILFPRGVAGYYAIYAAESGAAALSLDDGVPLAWARAVLQPTIALQGNLAPRLLIDGGVALREQVRLILAELGQGPFVFNLGHGILPETPPEHVSELAALVREGVPEGPAP
ncbi:MAG: uroporphyrinogen decarboxylase [Pseudomonadota bacterium]